MAAVGTQVYAMVTEPTGGVTRYLLDERGRETQVVAADGGVTTSTWSSGYLASETDALNRTTTYTRDSAGYVTRETLPDGNHRDYLYQSSFHALISYSDERGNVTTSTWDAGGHLTSTRDALGNVTNQAWASGLLQSVTDALNHSTTYLYDSYRRLQDTINALNQRTTLGYDANGNQQTLTDALGRVTTTVNDVMGRQTGSIDALGQRTTQTWDVSGLALTSTDELGLLTQQFHDSYGKGLLMQEVRGVGSVLPISTLENYDNAGRSIGSRGPTGYWRTQTLDGVGRAISSTDEVGNTSLVYFDLAGEVTAERNPLGGWTRHGYNSRGE